RWLPPARPPRRREFRSGRVAAIPAAAAPESEKRSRCVLSNSRSRQVRSNKKRGCRRHPLSLSAWLVLPCRNRLGGNVDVLIVDGHSVRSNRAADRRRRGDCPGACTWACEQVRVTRIRPEGIRVVDGRQPGIVTPEGAVGAFGELSRNGHGRAAHSLNAKGCEGSRATRDAYVRVSGHFIGSILAVVIGRGELPVLGEGDPLEPLIGRRLPGLLGCACQRSRVGRGPRERLSAVV